MHNFEVTGKAVIIRSGKLFLNPAQAAARLYALRKTDTDNIYTVVKPTSFKRGECFGYEGPELSKAVQVNLDESNEEAETSVRDQALAEINPDANVPISLLKDALEQKTIKATCELLLEKYNLRVAKGSDVVPPDIFAQIAVDYGFEFDEEPNVNA